MVYSRRLKRLAIMACRFESGPGHQESEAWPSGRRQLLAKESTPLNGSVSSNLTASSKHSQSLTQGNTMKPTKTFKLTKRTKTIMALIGFADQSQRNAFKNMMVQAQLASEVRPAKDKSDRK